MKPKHTPFFQVGDRVKVFPEESKYTRNEDHQRKWSAGTIVRVSLHAWGRSYDSYGVHIDRSDEIRGYQPQNLAPLSVLDDLALGEEKGGWGYHNFAHAFLGDWSENWSL